MPLEGRWVWDKKRVTIPVTLYMKIIFFISEFGLQTFRNEFLAKALSIEY